MKNKILGILIIAVVSLTSCSFILNEESETENSRAVLTFRATTNVLPSDTHSVRSVLPANLIEVSNLKNWKLNATFTDDGTESTLGTWETYSDFISSAISVKVGEWNFSLTAEGETATYEGTLSKKIIVGENFLNFILASKDGNGSININLYYSTNPNIKAVKAALFNINDGSSVENFGFENLSITDSNDEENYSGLKNVNYQKTSVPTGIYIVTFNFYSDTNCRTLLNTWTETVTVKGDDISSLSQIINLNESYAIYFIVNSGKWINWNNTNWANSSFKDKVGTYNIGASYTPYETVIFPTSENITRGGYDFEGWYTDSAFAEESKITGWLPETKQESFSVYAKWKLHDYSISYNLNGGTWSDGCVGVSSYTMEDGIISLPASSDFSKDGYFFKGWHLASDFSDENITQIDSTSMEDVQLYAEWYLDNYSISYDLMWNSLAENVTNPNELWAFSYGSQSYDLKDATFTDEKYTFAGWYLNYENGTYSELVTKLDENTALGSDSITLYAKWTITTRNCQMLWIEV